VSAQGRDPQREAMERIQGLARGQKGDKGAQGDPGRLSQLQGRAVVVLFVISVALSAFALFWVSHAVNVNNHKFCSVVTTLGAPVPRPADPKANPSREHQYTTYVKAVRLGRSLGCR
jgi:hypothetical protein